MYNFEDLTIGVKYVEWGDNVKHGTDCMGLVIHCLGKRGIDVEMLKDRKHSTFMKEATNGNWSPFDIEKEKVEGRTVVVGFLNVEGKVDHVGVMANNVYFWHCPDEKGITMSDITRPYWQRQNKLFFVHNIK